MMLLLGKINDSPPTSNGRRHRALVPFRSAVDDQSKWRLIDRPDFARRALDFLSLNEKEAGFLFNRKNVFPQFYFPPVSSFSTEKKGGLGLELMRPYKCSWPRRPHLLF